SGVGLPRREDMLVYCIKYLTFLWNLLFSVLGLLILAFGIWGLLAKESLVSERIAHLGSDPMLFFVLVGLAVSTVSLAGCVGALYENTCLLKFFTGGVITFVILEILGGLVLYSLRHQLKGSLQNTMLEAVLRYQDDPDLRFIMDEIQMGLQCCGADTKVWATAMLSAKHHGIPSPNAPCMQESQHQLTQLLATCLCCSCLCSFLACQAEHRQAACCSHTPSASLTLHLVQGNKQ
uniref:Tetraspanin n=1 Tax=Gopherus evgoodei TaxID=1825980 RepID=A0A8C4W2S6_9SAUR